MRRLFHTLLNTATVLSGALCMATAGLWVRGHFVIDGIVWISSAGPVEARGWSLVSASGAIIVRRTRLTNPPLNAVESAAWDTWRAKLPSGVQWRRSPLDTGSDRSSGFIFANDQRDVPIAWSSSIATRRDLRIGLPNWLIVLVTAILPALGATRYVRRRRDSRVELCVKCGYDLRATPERCPECGAVAENSAKYSS